MKKGLFYILTCMIVFALSGCGSREAPLTAADIINRSLIQVSDAKSIEFTLSVDESTAYGDKIHATHSVTKVKQIVHPLTVYSIWDSTTSKVDGSTERTIGEMYQLEHDGVLDLNLRYGATKDVSKPPTLSDWQENTNRDKESVSMLVDMNRNKFDAEIYLLSSNVDSFKKTDDTEAYEFEGTIAPNTVLEAYLKYVRDIYIRMKMIAGPSNPTLDDLKRELTNEPRPELQTGFTKLAYTDTPILVTIRINKNTYQLEKVVIDEKSVLQELLAKEIPKINPNLEKPSVKKAIYIFEIKGINTIEKIPLPE